MDFTEITRAQYAGGYKLHLWFNNGIEKTVDLKDELKGAAFEPLRDLKAFKDFRIVYNTVEWANGADLAPEYLYEIGTSM